MKLLIISLTLFLLPLFSIADTQKSIVSDCKDLSIAAALIKVIDSRVENGSSMSDLSLKTGEFNSDTEKNENLVGIQTLVTFKDEHSSNNQEFGDNLEVKVTYEIRKDKKCYIKDTSILNEDAPE